MMNRQKHLHRHMQKLLIHESKRLNQEKEGRGERKKEVGSKELRPSVDAGFHQKYCP